MFKSPKFLLLVVMIILSLLVAACAAAPPAEEAAPAEEEAGAEEPAPAEEEAAAEEAAPAEEEAEPAMAAGCSIEAPAEPVELNMMGWSFPITDFYADELEKCNEVENLTVNTNLLASADAQEQVRLALSAGGDSPFDIVHGANAQVAEWGGPGWLMPLKRNNFNELCFIRSQTNTG